MQATHSNTGSFLLARARGARLALGSNRTRQEEFRMGGQL